MDLGLNGKRALVTGASRGLGFALARGLVGEGCQVAINGRNRENLHKAAETLSAQTDVRVISIDGDVSRAADSDLIVKHAAEALDGLDILITNSGGPPAGKFDEFAEQTWNASVDLVFLSHVRLIHAALPYLRRSSAASVLTMTSYSVKQPIPNLVLSNSIRAATIGLTKSLAIELGSEGIRFNSILPGWTVTERVQELMAHRAEANRTSVEEEFAKQTLDIPLGRMGVPEEFARAAVFLVSPAASYITGVMLNVDGGITKSTF
jgi:3-oxoacyl-[acyl-carrier protein] reductase